ncbi:MAG TPA: CHASE2 domain-containing protein, partial [Pirellulaceae bacterium]|nr:CHASE2 domain-containing protein [Pirellulaceae bacterium]
MAEAESSPPASSPGAANPSPADPAPNRLVEACQAASACVTANFRETVCHHKRHWCIVLAIIVLFVLLGQYLEHQESLLATRYRMYRWVQNPWPRRLAFRDTIVVKIDDDEYWEQASGRVPLRRDYLATLLRKVGAANPAVIGVDVKLPSPNPNGNVKSTAANGKTLLEDKLYADESAELLDVISELSSSCKIVVAKSLKRAGSDSGTQAKPGHQTVDGHDRAAHPGRPVYSRVADIYDVYGIPLDQVVLAYTFLYPDRRHIPPRLLLDDGSEIDSFALAAARHFRPELVESKEWIEPRFASFVVRSETTEISAHDLMSATGPDARRIAAALQHKIVLIGGD